MILFAVARLAIMRLRVILASTLSCIPAVLAAAIYARKSMSSSGSILRNVALVVPILTFLVRHVLLL